MNNVEEFIKIYDDIGKQINDIESQLMDLKNRISRLSKSYVWIDNKKEKTHTEIIRNETNESMLNRMQGKINEPLKFGVLCLDDDYGGHPLTAEEFKSLLSNKDLKMIYFYNLNERDILRMIDIKEEIEVQNGV